MVPARFACDVLGVALFTSGVVAAAADDGKLKTDASSKLGKTLGSKAGAAECAADVIEDGFVNIDDLLTVISEWGVCP